MKIAPCMWLVVVFIIIGLVVGGADGCGCSGATRSIMGEDGTLREVEGEGIEQAELISHKVAQLQIEAKMVKIPAGSFRMGTDDGKGYVADGEGPPRKVTLSEFWLDETEVTNRDFKSFIDSTKYKTEAESFGWSFVFIHFVPPKEQEKITQAVKGAEWWLPVNGATWDHPEGPESNLSSVFPSVSITLPSTTPSMALHISPNRWDHPVVHVSWNDASAFCLWAHKRLPTEAEWEYAARGGLKRKAYGWGNEITKNGTHMMNVWQGSFPETNLVEDHHYGPAPVFSFPPNGYNLYNMEGNVWEWTSDWFTANHATSPSVNPSGPKNGKQRVMRGGSFLCHASYCFRYRTSSRSQNTPDSSTYNLGFRCASSVAP